MSEPIIRDVLTAEHAFMSEPKMRYDYELREKELSDHKTSLKMATKKGKTEGIELVAVNLLKMGINLNKVSEATGLTIERLKMLSKEQI